MKRKSGKPIVDLEKKPSVVHFNVGSGYLTYLEQDAPEAAPRVRRVVIARESASTGFRGSDDNCRIRTRPFRPYCGTSEFQRPAPSMFALPVTSTSRAWGCGPSGI